MMLKLGATTCHPIFSLKMAIRILFLGTLVWMGNLFTACPAGADDIPDAPITRVAFEATTSEAAQRDAIRSIPFQKMTKEDRVKVDAVVSNPSIFRRMPVKEIDCNPDLYLFLLRHPDVVVNIWEIMKVSHIQVRQIGQEKFQIVEETGTVGTVDYLFCQPTMHVIYVEGVYHGPLFARPVKGQSVLLLKSNYTRERNGRYHITSQLDSFVSIEHGGVELLTKTIQPLIGKTADYNFAQTLNFVSSLSRTIEVNSRSVQHLANRLDHVQPKIRTQFSELAGALGQKTVPAPKDTASYTETASYEEDLADRDGTD